VNQSEKIYVVAAIVLVALIVFSMGVIAAQWYETRVRTTGRIKGVGASIWADANATLGIEFIDWGTLEPGETKDLVVYIRSEGNVPMNLTMYTELWEPVETESFVTLLWDAEDAVIQPEEIRMVTFTLVISSDIEGIDNFSFDIVVVATG